MKPFDASYDEWIQRSRRDGCRRCNGTGFCYKDPMFHSFGVKECPVCDGTGKSKENQPPAKQPV